MTVEQAIKELIFEHSTITVPELGTFIGEYKSASIDAVQGQLKPPSLNLTFNSDKVLNDGVLLAFLQSKNKTSTAETQQMIDDFVAYTRSIFERRELLQIPDVGRLYLDFADKIQFLPDNTNFNTDAYSLPTAQFYPISRNRIEAQNTTHTEPPTQPPLAATIEDMLIAATPTASTATLELEKKAETTSATTGITEKNAIQTETDYKRQHYAQEPYIPAPVSDKISDKQRWILAIVSGIALIVVFVAIYKMFEKDVTEGVPKRPKMAVQDDISGQQLGGYSTAPVTTPPPQVPQNQAVVPTTQQQQQPTILPDDGKARTQNQASVKPNIEKTAKKERQLVLLGNFGDAQNIKNIKKWITSNGFEVYEQKKGVLTEMGMWVVYTTAEEKNKGIAKIRKKYGNNIIIN